MPKIEMKINRYVKHIGKNDLIMDNGSCIKWLWENRDWENTRQKFKAMAREVKADE